MCITIPLNKVFLNHFKEQIDRANKSAKKALYRRLIVNVYDTFKNKN